MSDRARNIFCYACEIKETTNGGRRSTRGQARKTFEEIPQRRIERNVQIDEQSGAAPHRQNKAQKIADQEAEKKITFRPTGDGKNYNGWKTLVR